MASKVRIKGTNSKKLMRTEYDWPKDVCVDIRKGPNDSTPTPVSCCITFDQTESQSPNVLRSKSSIANVRDYLLQ